MLLEPLPTADKIKKDGKFIGYLQYDEVYSMNHKNYVLLDFTVQNGRRFEVKYHVHRYYGQLSRLVSGYNEYTGEPL